jgi:toxin ParE1/3/4
MNLAEVLYSRRAEADLLSISKFTLETWGRNQANRYLTELVDCCQRLAENPMLGRTCGVIRGGLRRCEHGKHVVFFRQNAKGIVVSRILHGSMSPRRHPMDEET